MTDLRAWQQEVDTAIARKMGLELLAVSRDEVAGRIPVEGNTQPFGVLHGGASAYLAETLASVAALAEVGPGGRASGIELNATHHAPARDGWVTGVARPLRVGRTIATYEVVLTDDRGDRVCTARLTLFLQRTPSG